MLHAGVKPARKISGQLREAIEFLAATPRAGHVREDLTFRQVRFWPVISYLIIYNAEASPIEIVRILDGRRDVADVLLSSLPA